MKTFFLRRIIHNLDATWGVMIYNREPFCVTLELPWKQNRRSISCIPAGTYTAFRRFSGIKGRGWVYQLMGVKGRTAIQIHKGNFTSDVLGCILVAEKYERIGGKIAVQQSRQAFKEFMSKTGKDKKILLRVIAPNLK